MIGGNRIRFNLNSSTVPCKIDGFLCQFVKGKLLEAASGDIQSAFDELKRARDVPPSWLTIPQLQIQSFDVLTFS